MAVRDVLIVSSLFMCARSSANSLPSNPLCPGIQATVKRGREPGSISSNKYFGGR